MILANAERVIHFFVSRLHRFPQDLVLQSLLPEHALGLPGPLFLGADVGVGNDFIVHADSFFSTIGHMASPTEEQAGTATMGAGYVGNRHAGLGGFNQDGKLLVPRIPAALDPREDFDSSSIDRHSRSVYRSVR
jgi:hypothetical protein